MAEERATVRLAELVASLSLGIDLGFGQPMEHVLRQCRIALRIADLVDLDGEGRAALYYSALLVNVGCHTDAHEQARWCGDDIALRSTKYDYEQRSLREAIATLRLLGSGNQPVHRMRVVLEFALSGHKEVEHAIEDHARMARSLGEELGLPDAALTALAASYERWDGRGWPGLLAGDAIPLVARITQLAEFVEVAHRVGGVAGARALATGRAGSQFDPGLAAVFCADIGKVLHQIDELDAWATVIDEEPALTRRLTMDEFDAALAAIARFVDLKSPFTLGHSIATAELATAVAARLGKGAAEARTVRHAALVSGYGRLGVSNAIWDKRGHLSASDWERVRLHPQLTERMLHQSEVLAPLGRIAGQLRERLDGSGYPHGLSGGAIGTNARILAAADAYQSMCEPRPHRAALSRDEAATALRADARAGRLDGTVVDAVLDAAGHRSPQRRDAPDGLTAREVDVLRLVARGLSTKDVATRLSISPKTVGNHIEHIYTKIGVTNRAGASLYAMRRGLLPEDAIVVAG